jgi:hypothetical protein
MASAADNEKEVRTGLFFYRKNLTTPATSDRQDFSSAS